MCHFEGHLLNAVLFQPLCAEWPLDANDSVFVFIMLREFVVNTSILVIQSHCQTVLRCP